MIKINGLSLQVVIHSTIWLCLFSYPFLFHYADFTDLMSVSRISLFFIIIVLFFYLNFCVLIPRLLGATKFFLYFACIILLIIAISWASGYIQYVLNPEIKKKPQLFSTGVNTGAIISFLAWVASSGIKITGEWFRNEQLRRSIENEKLQSELSFLRTQVNPHFLFNALNNIYSLQSRNSPQTGNAILKLSRLARYVLYETSVDTVELEKEAEYLENYIALQKLGLDGIKVDYEKSGDFTGKKIEPMLLIPLVENAFKHGISYEKKTPVGIQLSLNGKELCLRVENGLLKKELPKDKTSGIGLANLSKRLQLLYPGNYTLTVDADKDKLIAELKLKLQHD